MSRNILSKLYILNYKNITLILPQNNIKVLLDNNKKKQELLRTLY